MCRRLDFFFGFVWTIVSRLLPYLLRASPRSRPTKNREKEAREETSCVYIYIYTRTVLLSFSFPFALLAVANLLSWVVGLFYAARKKKKKTKKKSKALPLYKHGVRRACISRVSSHAFARRTGKRFLLLEFFWSSNAKSFRFRLLDLFPLKFSTPAYGQVAWGRDVRTQWESKRQSRPVRASFAKAADRSRHCSNRARKWQELWLKNKKSFCEIKTRRGGGALRVAPPPPW